MGFQKFQHCALWGILFGWTAWGCMLGSVCTEYWAVAKVDLVAPNPDNPNITVVVGKGTQHIGIYRTCYTKDTLAPWGGQCGPSGKYLAYVI